MIAQERAVMKQALEALEAMKAEFRAYDLPYGSKAYTQGNEASHILRAALAQEQPEPMPTHRINSWGFCGVCRHDRIPGEGCARQECPGSPNIEAQRDALLAALKQCSNAIQGGQTIEPYDSRGAGYQQCFGISFLDQLNAAIRAAEEGK